VAQGVGPEFKNSSTKKKGFTLLHVVAYLPQQHLLEAVLSPLNAPGAFLEKWHVAVWNCGFSVLRLWSYVPRSHDAFVPGALKSVFKSGIVMPPALL
jgi:hypothetical protein